MSMIQTVTLAATEALRAAVLGIAVIGLIVIALVATFGRGNISEAGNVP